jgi:hypothetical protein
MSAVARNTCMRRVPGWPCARLQFVYTFAFSAPSRTRTCGIVLRRNTPPSAVATSKNPGRWRASWPKLLGHTLSSAMAQIAPGHRHIHHPPILPPATPRHARKHGHPQRRRQKPPGTGATVRASLEGAGKAVPTVLRTAPEHASARYSHRGEPAPQDFSGHSPRAKISIKARGRASTGRRSP